MIIFLDFFNYLDVNGFFEKNRFMADDFLNIPPKFKHNLWKNDYVFLILAIKYFPFMVIPSTTQGKIILTLAYSTPHWILCPSIRILIMLLFSSSSSFVRISTHSIVQVQNCRGGIFFQGVIGQQKFATYPCITDRLYLVGRIGHNWRWQNSSFNFLQGFANRYVIFSQIWIVVMCSTLALS